MHAVLEALRTFPSEDNPCLRDFPRGSCSVASFVIGSVFRERGLGDWTLVAGEGADEATGDYRTHVWLELRENGETLFTLDATAHQFPQWASGPLVVRGESPLARYFAVRRDEAPVSRPFERMGDAHHLRPLEYVRRKLAVDGQRERP